MRIKNGGGTKSFHDWPAAAVAKVAPVHVESPFSRVHVPQALAVAQYDLTRAGKSEHTLAVELRKCP